MNTQRKATKGANNTVGPTGANSGNFTRKPRRSIKAEGNCLNGMLRDGLAKVIDASKLGKRLSSEIWNSFGAIQVEDSFTYPSIDTKTVVDGSTTLKICQFFVACSKCFSVFKYDGHAYGTTGLVKHVKICQGTNQRDIASLSYTQGPGLDNANEIKHTQSVPNVANTTNSISTANNTITLNGTVSTRRRQNTMTSPRAKNNQPSLRYLAKVIEELKCEQAELKQKVYEMINLMSNQGYVSHIQIIANDGDKVEDELQKTD